MKKVLLLILCLIVIKPLFAQIPTQVIFCITYSQLMTYDADDCTYSVIAPLSTTGSSTLSDIAFTPNGKLYGINYYDIVELDTATGEATPVCSNSYMAYGGSTSLIHLNDSILITQGFDSLYAININDCSITSMGYTGVWLDGDLTWYGGDLYGIGAGTLYKIELDSSHTSVTSVTILNDASNPLSVGWGLVTVGENKNQGKILIFGEYPWLTSVNPETVDIDTICLPSTLYGVWGAATCIRYIDTTTVVDTTADTDTIVTSLNNLDDNVDVKIYPNPVLGDKFNVQSGKGLVKAIRLHDNLGRHISISHHSIGSEVTINLPPNLASGLYILELISGRHSIKKKVLVK